MITLLYGDNDFELSQKVAQLKARFDGHAERYDAAELNNERLADIFAGQTLFNVNRLVLIDAPSANPDLWNKLPEWTERLSEATHLVLVEPKVDKRTSVYKWLIKHADAQQFAAIDDRDTDGLAQWIEHYANGKGVKLTRQQARRLAGKGTTNQWVIAHAIDKLGLLDEVTDRWIDDVIEDHPLESVFTLFDMALNNDAEHVARSIERLRLTEDPYRLLGLLSSQVLQLAALVYGHGDATQVARDTGAKSSYPFQKLAPHATRLNRDQVAKMVRVFADTDARLKSSDADPWLVLESTLTRVASLR